MPVVCLSIWEEHASFMIYMDSAIDGLTILHDLNPLFAKYLLCVHIPKN